MTLNSSLYLIILSSLTIPLVTIDVVVTWDNINKKTINKFIKNQRDITNRYQFNNEIKYNLQLLSHQEWVDWIYVVTQSNLNVIDMSFINQTKIKIINHKDIIPKIYLPTYSSNVIECYLHKIKDLSNISIYLNDDFLLRTNITTSKLFIENMDQNIRDTNFDKLSSNSQILFQSTFGKNIDYVRLLHHPYVLDRKVLQMINEIFYEQIHQTSVNKVRTDHDILCLDLMYMYMIEFDNWDYQVSDDIDDSNEKLLKLMTQNRWNTLCLQHLERKPHIPQWLLEFSSLPYIDESVWFKVMNYII